MGIEGVIGLLRAERYSLTFKGESELRNI